MKLTGVFGTGSGKVGSAVFATAGGEQIVRQYQPKVANPNTDAQVEQRAKFKLLSQLAAAMAPVIVIPKQGLTSARNRFVSINSSLVSYNNGAASVNLQNIQLTDSIVAIPNINVYPTVTANTVSIDTELNDNINEGFDKLAVILFKKTDDEKLFLVATKIKDIDYDDATVPMSFGQVDIEKGKDYVVYAYAIKAKSNVGKALFEDYIAEPGEDYATLATNKSFNSGNFSFSHTTGNGGTIPSE